MIKVIIVEDEENIRKSIEYVINWEECGCTVVGTAFNGKDGLELIKRIEPDIVITDIIMPFKDGLQMLEESSVDVEFESIIISGYNEFDYAKKAIQLEVKEYILKPIDYKELKNVIIKTKDVILSKRALNNKSNHKVYYSQRMKDIIDFIDENIEKKLSLKVLCNEFNISSTSLNSLFKKEVNTTVNDYINKTKIQSSINLLKTERYLISEIAEIMGFSDYKYFSQVFKKYTNMSPTEFLNKR